MKKKPEFHGSDLEKIADYYHLNKENIILFGANVNPLGLSGQVKKDLAAHLDVISSYPDRNYTDLKKAIAFYTGSSAEHIVVGNGSTELISLLISQRAPKKALLLGPTYSEYARELNLVGGTLEYYNLKEEQDFKLDISDLTDALKSDIDLLIICNPNNPTSSAISTSDIRELLSVCRSLGIFVMIDETYIEFAPKGAALSAVPLVPEFDNFMVIRGVSKFFAAPGLRFGYGLTSNQAFLQTLLTHQNPWSLNSVGAYAGERMLKDTDYIKKTWTLIDSERTRMCTELSGLDTVKIYPAYANFVLVRILKEGLTSFDVFEKAIHQDLMIRDCSSFESLNGEYVRFCIMNPEDNDRLLDVFRSL
ncbi:pyridoxal phosphate-dependent aminotransferase [Dorea formicigenerans]|uniref:pyridoxal phosphate-dependent aminotransferase n=1 Tax=Dorea formicigenerans TaxID=39486 RepID=UPI001D00414C|nr:histidinol-phosphate transaminase [Dorea formicigenerans]MCB5500875.1 aminotransferase class I/II-fold pyridoxal phosphate-dependent enzyme [Dorea formicigenerans]